VSQSAALEGIVECVRFALTVLGDDGSSAPEPLSVKRYSGKVLLRMTPEKHRELAMEAAYQHVSLNRLIASRL